MKTSVSMAEWFDAFSDVFGCGSCEQVTASENMDAAPCQDRPGTKGQKGQSSKKALQVL